MMRKCERLQCIELGSLDLLSRNDRADQLSLRKDINLGSQRYSRLSQCLFMLVHILRSICNTPFDE